MSPALAGGFFTSEPPRCGSLVWSNVCGTATGEADTAEQSLGEFMAIPVFFSNLMFTSSSESYKAIFNKMDSFYVNFPFCT